MNLVFVQVSSKLSEFSSGLEIVTLPQLKKFAVLLCEILASLID